MRVSRSTRAGLGRRLGSLLIDSILIISVQTGLLIIPWFLYVGYACINVVRNSCVSEALNNLNQSFAIILVVLGLIVSFVSYWLYSAFLESSNWQATIGKRVLGLWVTDEIGVRLSFKRATLRAVFKYPFWLFFTGALCQNLTGRSETDGFSLLGFLLSCVWGLYNFGMIGMVLLTEKRQGIHDKVAHSIVLTREIEMPRIFIDQRRYIVDGKNVIVTGDNPALDNIHVGDTDAVLNLENFAEELLRVRSKIQEQPPSNERDISTTILRAAEDEARRGDAHKMREHLSMLGKWVTNFAVDVGANLVAEAVIKLAGVK